MGLVEILPMQEWMEVVPQLGSEENNEFNVQPWGHMKQKPRCLHHRWLIFLTAS